MSTRAMTATSTWDVYWDVYWDRRCGLPAVRAWNSCGVDIRVDIEGASFGHDHHDDTPSGPAFGSHDGSDSRFSGRA
jgi:hypothetical protein